MLTNIQTQVLDVFATLDGNQEYAVAGGSGLIAAGLYDRATQDLDLFTSTGDIGPFIDRFITALETAGLTVQPIRRVDTFAHIRVSNQAGEATDIDVAKDYQMLPAQLTGNVMVLDPKELAANKMLALWGRAEPRDLDDVLHLTRRFPLADMCEWAGQKDLGFEPGFLASHLRREIFTDMGNPGLTQLITDLDTIAADVTPPADLDVAQATPPIPDASEGLPGI